MKYFTLVIAAFLCTPAFAANTCPVTQGSFVFDRVVTVGKTTTYFAPRLILGPDQFASFVSVFSDSQYGTAACRALGHEKGRVGSSDFSITGNDLAVRFKPDGTLDVVENFCQSNSDCDARITSLTCE